MKKKKNVIVHLIKDLLTYLLKKYNSDTNNNEVTNYKNNYSGINERLTKCAKNYLV